MKILLVEDDRMIGWGLRRGLLDEGFTVDWLDDGDAAVVVCSEQSYDAAILDLGLPNRDGIKVLAELRHRGNTLPIVVLTARESVADRIKGLNAGADDYVCKPFDFDELVARLRAVMRRRAGVVLTRDQLRNKLYGWDDDVGSNTVEVFIHSLRRKLGHDYIENVRSVGYRVPLP